MEEPTCGVGRLTVLGFRVSGVEICFVLGLPMELAGLE